MTSPPIPGSLLGERMLPIWRAARLYLDRHGDDRRGVISYPAVDPASMLVLKSLIGLDAMDAEDLLSGWLDPMAEAKVRLEFLPGNKRQSMMDIVMRSIEREHGETNPEKVAASAKQSEAEINALLTPRERYEYDLRESVLASKVKAALMEIDPSEEEFRTIYDAWKNLYAASQRSEADYLQSRSESDREILRLVGPERFERYSKGAKSWGYGR